MMSTSHVYDEPTNVGDVVWAKMNSFPFWPARIATMGEAYAENHKKKDNSVAFNSDLNQKYCNDKSKQGFVFVNFFGSFDYAWVRVSGNKGTKPFDQSDASRRLRKLKKSKPYVVAIEDADQYCMTGVFIRSSRDWFTQLESRRQYEEKERLEQLRVKEQQKLKVKEQQLKMKSLMRAKQRGDVMGGPEASSSSSRHKRKRDDHHGGGGGGGGGGGRGGGGNGGSKSTKSSKSNKKKKGEPKRARGAYTFFMQASRPQIQEDNPDATFGDVARLVSSAWKSLSAKNRTIYTDLADVDKERSRREHDTWEKKRAARRARGEPSSQEEGQEEEEEDRSSGSDDDDDERAVKKKRLSRTKKKKRKKKRRRTQDETGVGRVLSSGVEESSSSEEEDDDARRNDGGDGGDKDDDRPDISESVCFVCRLGGNLMMCDYKGCPKVYVQTGEKAKRLHKSCYERLHESCACADQFR